MRKYLLLFLLLLCLPGVVGFSWSSSRVNISWTNFTNQYGVENLSFEEAGSFVRYSGFPYGSFVLESNLTLSGYELPIINSGINLNNISNRATVAMVNQNRINDQDLGSYSRAPGNNYDYQIYINFTNNLTNTTAANLSFFNRLGQNVSLGGFWAYCYNYSAGAWTDNYFQVVNFALLGTPNDEVRSADIPHECWENQSIVQFQIYVNQRTQSPNIWELWLNSTWLNADSEEYPHNVSLLVDNVEEFNYGGSNNSAFVQQDLNVSANNFVGTWLNNFNPISFSFLSNTSGVLEYDNMNFSAGLNFSLGYETSISEGDNSSYLLDLSGDIWDSADLWVWNSTSWNSFSSDRNAGGSQYVNFSAGVVSPLLHNASTVWSFYWLVNYSGAGLGSGTLNISGFTQNVYQLGITNCSTSNASMVINVTIFQEDVPNNNVVSGLEAFFLLYNITRSNARNVSFNLSGGSNYGFCLEQNTSYSADLYFLSKNNLSQPFYGLNYTLSPGVVHEVFLYNWVFNYTNPLCDLKLTVLRKDNLDVFPNIVSTLQRFYVGEGVWRNVQWDRSDEFGQMLFDVLERSVSYKLIFVDEFNNLLNWSNELKFVCSDGVVDVTYLISPYSGGGVGSELLVWYVLDNVSDLLNVSWSGSTGVSRSVNIVVSRETLVGEHIVCNTTQSGVSGVYSCNVSGLSGHVKLVVFETYNPTLARIVEWIRVGTLRLEDALESALPSVGGREGVFWTGGFFVTIAGAGVVGGVIGVIVMSIVALVASLFLGATSLLNIGVIIFSIVIGFFIAYKVRK